MLKKVFLVSGLFFLMVFFSFQTASNKSKKLGLKEFSLLKTSIESGGTINPTQYVSLYPDPQLNVKKYGRATRVDSHGNAVISNIYQSGYVQYFRIFIPPGTMMAMVEVLEWQGQSAIARHKISPVSVFGQLPNSSDITLTAYEQADGYSKGLPPEQSIGRCAIMSDGFPPPYLSTDRAGWFYVKMDEEKYSPSYYTTAQVTVNAEAYNDWYDHSGSNPDGSINWEKDVESVETYLLRRPSPEPSLAPSPVPSPMPKPTFLPGDLNQDKKIDVYDYNLLVTNFGRQELGNVADIDGDGKVGVYDYNLLVINFGKTSEE